MNVDISVIVPVYNVEKYIEKCIASLITQDCRNIEFIIVNDGSKDSSISLCEKMISGDTRFRIIQKENGGLMSAWKAGVLEAKGRYIGFVDSDDWVDANMFSALLEKIVSTDADIVSSGYIAEGDDHSVTIGRDKEYIYSGEKIRQEFVQEYCCSYFRDTCHPTICRWDKLYKKDLIIRNMQYFNEKVSMGEDFNANIAMILDSKKIVLMESFTPYHYRYNPSSIANSFNPRAFDNIIELSRVCNVIVKEKATTSLYIDSFIGNMIFEEINKRCRGSYNKKTSKELRCSLRECNANYYLAQYVNVRKKLRLKVFLMAVRFNCIGAIYLMNRIYNAGK